MAESASLHPSPSAQLGALDLGSNSFHLLVAQDDGGRLKVIDKHKEMVRLAGGLDADGNLSSAAIERALECLQRFAQRLRPLDPANVRIVGTNTLRKAKRNGFVQQAEDILQHKIEIISGREEARLIYLGVCHDLGQSDTNRLVIDIGGGSTELILGKRNKPIVLESLYMGCVAMTQACFSDGTCSLKKMEQAIDTALVELEPIVQTFTESGWDDVVGTSGTINAVASVLSNLYGHEQILAEDLEQLVQRVGAITNLEALDFPGLASERRAVFAGGVAILAAVFRALKIKTMTTSQSALREGCLVDLMDRQHHEDTRDQTVAEVMQRFHINQRQAQSVRETAIALLSQVAASWELTNPQDRQLLTWAANLHEIGMDIAHSGYHKHSAYLIENLDMPGFAVSDQRDLGALVRNHRRKLVPDLLHEPRLQRLAVILRIAALLHRNRSNEIAPHIAADAADNRLTLRFDATWWAQHALTQLDLANERAYLEQININLTIDQ